MKTGAAIDRTYARKTAKALASRKVWTVESVQGRAACAKRLTQISHGSGIVLDAYPKSGEAFEIVWWTWK